MRNDIQLETKPFDIINESVRDTNQLNKSFWVNGYEYDVENNRYNMSLKEIVW